MSEQREAQVTFCWTSLQESWGLLNNQTGRDGGAGLTNIKNT